MLCNKHSAKRWLHFTGCVAGAQQLRPSFIILKVISSATTNASSGARLIKPDGWSHQQVIRWKKSFVFTWNSIWFIWMILQWIDWIWSNCNLSAVLRSSWFHLAVPPRRLHYSPFVPSSSDPSSFGRVPRFNLTAAISCRRSGRFSVGQKWKSSVNDQPTTRLCLGYLESIDIHWRFTNMKWIQLKFRPIFPNFHKMWTAKSFPAQV